MGINKVILVGNLGKDPELRYTPSGSPVVTFSLATTERYTSRDGQAQKRTEWHNIVVWNKLAELVNQYLKKGRSVYLEGRIANRSWDDRDGNKRYRTEIVANQIEFLGAGPGSDQPEVPSESDTQPEVEESAAVAEDATVVEDDLPF